MQVMKKANFSAVEKRNDGCFLLNPRDVAASVVPGFTRADGGWIRHVTGMDTNRTDIHSFKGNMLLERKQWLRPGVYLDCSKDRNFIRTYTVFILKPDGTVRVLGEQTGGENWVVNSWNAIRAGLDEINEDAREASSIIRAETERLVAYEEFARKIVRVAELRSEGPYSGECSNCGTAGKYTAYPPVVRDHFCSECGTILDFIPISKTGSETNGNDR